MTLEPIRQVASDGKRERIAAAALEQYFQDWKLYGTPEGIFSFNLSKLPEPEWADKWMPTTTEFANTKKIMKKVGFLDISLAKEFGKGAE